MVQIVDELITLLTFDADTTKVEKWKKGMEAATKVSGALLKGLAGVTASVAGYVKLVAMSTGENYAYARSVGVNVRQYEQLTRVAKVFGGEVGDVQSYIEKWSPLIASNGGDIMNEFTNQFKTLAGIQNQFERRQQAQAYGWSDAMLQATYHAETAHRVLNSAGKVQESEYRLMYETNLQFNELWQQLIWTLQDGVVQAGPKLKNIVSDVTTWVRKMSPGASKSISNFIQGFADGLRESWPAIKNMIKFTGKLSGKLLNLFKTEESIKRWANIFKIAIGVTAVGGLVAFIGKVIVGAKEVALLFKTLNGLAVWFGHGALVTSLSLVGAALAGWKIGRLIAEFTGFDKWLRQTLANSEEFRKFVDWMDNRFNNKSKRGKEFKNPSVKSVSTVEYINKRTRAGKELIEQITNPNRRYQWSLLSGSNVARNNNTTINITLNGTGSNYSDAKFIGSTVRNALSSLGVAVREQ